MNELKSGQKVFILYIGGNHHLRTGELKEVEILEVKRKYFTIKGYKRDRFFVDTLKHDGGEYMSQYMIYLEKEIYEKERQNSKNQQCIRRYVERQSMTLEQSKSIVEILGINVNE